MGAIFQDLWNEEGDAYCFYAYLLWYSKAFKVFKKKEGKKILLKKTLIKNYAAVYISVKSRAWSLQRYVEWVPTRNFFFFKCSNLPELLPMTDCIQFSNLEK